jgi:hypothetical protein
MWTTVYLYQRHGKQIAIARGRVLATNSGVNAHFQSGIAECRIRELQDNARVLLIHAQRRWPTAITPNVWPYAIRMSSDAFNEGPLKFLKGRCPIEVFSHGQIKAKPRKSWTWTQETLDRQCWRKYQAGETDPFS